MQTWTPRIKYGETITCIVHVSISTIYVTAGVFRLKERTEFTTQMHNEDGSWPARKTLQAKRTNWVHSTNEQCNVAHKTVASIVRKPHTGNKPLKAIIFSKGTNKVHNAIANEAGSNVTSSKVVYSKSPTMQQTTTNHSASTLNEVQQGNIVGLEGSASHVQWL